MCVASLVNAGVQPPRRTRRQPRWIEYFGDGDLTLGGKHHIAPPASLPPSSLRVLEPRSIEVPYTGKALAVLVVGLVRGELVQRGDEPLAGGQVLGTWPGASAAERLGERPSAEGSVGAELVVSGDPSVSLGVFDRADQREVVG